MAVGTRDTPRGDYDPDYGRKKSKAGLWIVLAVLVLAAIAVIAFFALGGDADVDGEVDVEAPNIDVQEGDDANVDAESEEGN